MKKILIGFILVFATLQFKSYSNPNDPVLLEINERKVTLSEFEYVYTKNNLNPQVMDPKSIDEYLELFINFNLKVYEALQLGMDTNNAFVEELGGYREQLAQPYLTDQEVTNHLVEEAMERLKFDVRASHILINLEEHAAPEDTLKAWNRMMEIREKIIEGESFEKMASKFSDDPSAKGMDATPNRPAMRGNNGDLGYFTVFNMVYPFESAAYNTPVGEISQPVRSRFGYHLIKVTDKLPALGKAKVAHIMVATPPDATPDQQEQAKEKINEIYQKTEDGEDFESLAQRFSDDKSSGRRGGELPAFTSNRMVPQFIKAIADINNNPGEISEPILTPYGWHIIKLIEKTPPDQQESVEEVKNKIKRDQRAGLSEQVVLQKLKNEYDFAEYPENLDIFYQLVDESVFNAKWNHDSLMNTAQKPLFAFAEDEYTQSDFAKNLHKTQAVRSPESIRNYVNSMYENFVKQQLFDYEKERLPEKYPEFRQILQEYHDGILLFELTDQKVWSKAMEDTAGLKEFFRKNIQDYYWDDRFSATVFTFNSAEDAKKGRKKIRKALKKGVSEEELMSEFNQESQTHVSKENGLFEISDTDFWENISEKPGVSKVIMDDEEAKVVQVHEFLPSQPKKIDEVRGLVIADYQNHLEERWIKELRSKYDFVVHREVLNQLNIND